MVVGGELLGFQEASGMWDVLAPEIARAADAG